ncbi:MAG: hypothetical protein NVS1B1_09980 [Candidatus Limnocylindrales bacterium]
MFGFTARELAVLRRLDTPVKVQAFLERLAYNYEPDGDTCRSPRRVLRERTAHCAEGAIFAAAAFRVHGRPPLLVDLEAVNDDDHVLAAYRDRGLWGAVGMSKFAGLRHRAPVHRTVRELAISYFNDYYNYEGQLTLRRYSRPVSLAPFDAIGWMTSEQDLWPILERLVVAPHSALIPPAAARRLPDLDRRSYDAGLHRARHR